MKSLRYAALAFIVVVIVLMTLLGETWRAREAALTRELAAKESQLLTHASTARLDKPHVASRPANDGLIAQTAQSDAAAETTRNTESDPPPVRVANREQRLAHLAVSSGAKQHVTRLYLNALKGYDAIAWLTHAEDSDDIAPDIAWHSARTGDLETARTFMLHALQKETDPAFRRYISGQLAWLEDDPDVAAALLESSCEANTFLELRNAIEFAHATGNAALERYYRERPAVDGENVVIYHGPLGSF